MKSLVLDVRKKILEKTMFAIKDLILDEEGLDEYIQSFCKSISLDFICYLLNENNIRDDLEKDMYVENLTLEEFLYNFPELEKTIEVYVDYISGFLIKLNNNIITDLDELGRFGFMVEKNEKIKFSILGDAHESGMVVDLCNEKNQRIIFKPRSFANEIYVNKCIQNAKLKLPLIQGIDKREYSWHKFEENKNMLTNKYYYQIGQFLFLLNILGVSDMHYENVIFTEGGPMILDCETIHTQTLSANFEDLASFQVNEYLAKSIIGIGILPISVSSKFSVFNKEAKINIKVPKIEFKDSMYKLVEVEKNIIFESNISYNVIKLNIDLLMLGFEDAKKQWFLSLEGFEKVYNEMFWRMSFRKLYRHTASYTKLLRYKNSLKSYVSPANIEKYLKLTPGIPESIIQQELISLRKNVIPAFLYELTEELKDEILEQVKMKLKIDFFTFNKKIIKMAFCDSEVCDFISRNSPIFIENESVNELDIGKMKQEISLKVIDNGIYDFTDNSVCWIEAAATYEGDLDLTMTDNSFYSGRKGIIYTLLMSEEKLKNQSLLEEVYKKIAGGHEKFSYIDIENMIFDNKDTVQSVDVMSGLAGKIFYALNNNDESSNIFGIVNLLIQKIEKFDYSKLKVGYIHGLGGISLAIIKAGCFFKSVEILEKGLNLFELEISNIDISNGNISIPSNKNNPRSIDWCTGIGGVCAILLAFESYKESVLLENSKYIELSDKVSELLELSCNYLLQFSKEVSNMSICHGQSGSILLLYEAKKQGILSKKQNEKLIRYTKDYLNLVSRGELFFGVNRTFDKNSLFLGKCGVLYTLHYIENYKKLNTIMYM